MTLLLSELESKELPIAEGGWTAANSSYYGAKVKRNLEDMKAKGFTHVPWKGRCRTYGQLDAEDGRANRLGERGKAPWPWRLLSCTLWLVLLQGQPQPQCLGGPRQEMMREFISKPSTQHVAVFQSALFALWFPKSYAEFRRWNSQIKEKIPAFNGNIKGSVYLCCTANCGPNSWAHIHCNGRNTAGACCGVTAGGRYGPKDIASFRGRNSRRYSAHSRVLTSRVSGGGSSLCSPVLSGECIRARWRKLWELPLVQPESKDSGGSGSDSSPQFLQPSETYRAAVTLLHSPLVTGN
ncbi:hypothetical protein BDP27DRAFT_1409754 [Rhodocollybia butyracea]|uniref:Uncharacterized protein n=1 Tax=Rhodocollybia butyracea TaxID=206335 RepID=A0A9P5P717_9AGAR|nr:hypothetical protein BDP27DRAFT_1409754 [Rhodocollybia butyracea]